MWLGRLSSIQDILTSEMLKDELPGRYICLYSRLKYILHKLEFILLEVLNLYYILPNVILRMYPPSVSLFRLRTRIIGNIRHDI